MLDISYENDLRYIDHYLTRNEKDKWNERNIVYNTLWFYLNKSVIDIEYCDSAIDSYRKLQPFKDWNYVYHSNGGKVLYTPKGEKFNADIMTGWWNPFKYFLKKDNESRKSIAEILKEVPQSLDYEVLLNWMKKCSGGNIDACQSLIEFLKVVYTYGNIIPAPINWRGNGLDGWCYKISNIKNNNQSKQCIAWNQYINRYYTNFDDFIEKNKLSMYAEDDIIKSVWSEDVPKSFSDATPKQWKNYFYNCTEMIKERTRLITEIEVL